MGKKGLGCWPGSGLGPECGFHCGRSWWLRKFQQFIKSRPWWGSRGAPPPPHPWSRSRLLGRAEGGAGKDGKAGTRLSLRLLDGPPSLSAASNGNKMKCSLSRAVFSYKALCFSK